jgi:(p)ppGpp synthase/HD superfamily hydrolase
MDHVKQTIALRAWLLGRGYTNASRALEISIEGHEGQTRKSSGEPYVSHPVAVAQLTRCYSGLLGDYAETAIAVALLHDVLEDTDVTKAQLYALSPEIADNVQVLTKGADTPWAHYTQQLANYPVAAFVKACDRLHNLATMPGAFSLDKAHDYVEETHRYILPMMKGARRYYPEYEQGFEALKFAILAATAPYRHAEPST